MRFSVAIAVAALASSVSATFVARQSLPSCAIQCLTTADFDGCQQTDNACLCRSTKFVQGSTDCIDKTCTGADLQSALTAAQQLCAAVGVTLTSTPAGAATGAQPSATAPAASGAGSSASGSHAASSGAAAPSGSGAAASGSGASGAAGSSAPAASPTSAASINGISTVAGIAALGLAALAL